MNNKRKSHKIKSKIAKYDKTVKVNDDEKLYNLINEAGSELANKIKENPVNHIEETAAKEALFMYESLSNEENKT